MVKKKVQSKRQPLKLKYKIKKKVKEHDRKMRKLAKMNPNPKSSLKKDPGIPNLFPLKEALLRQAERKKEQMAEEKKAEKLKRKQEIQKKREANKKQTAAEKTRAEKELKQNDNTLKRGTWYMKELKKVLEECDVILEVLDARDPMGCRAPNIEKLILGKYSAKAVRPKKIILVMNKIDLVPSEVASQWLAILRREFPTIAFKSSTQQQKANLKQSSSNALTAAESLKNSSQTLGANALLQLLKNYTRSQDIKTAIKVGVIGYPNVGKSSIINSLKRSRAVGVGSMPGFTKAVQEVHLDKHIKLLDSPGVLFSTNDTGLLLRNCIKVEQIEDPIPAVHEIVKRCTKEQLMDVFEVGTFESADQFISHVAHKRGKLMKGGIPDLAAACRSILRDWNEGKIPFYARPPEDKTEKSAVEVVDTWGKEFNIDALLEESNTEALKDVSEKNKSVKFTSMKSNSLKDMEAAEEMDFEDEDDENDGEENEDEEDDMEFGEEEEEEEEDGDDDANEDAVEEKLSGPRGADPKNLGKMAKGEEAPATSVKKQTKPETTGLNAQRNKAMKMEQKKQKKAMKKAMSRPVSDNEDDGNMQAGDNEESYDFAAWDKF